MVHQNGFVAQTVERHVEGVSVAVSKSAEATNFSALSLAWLEAVALHPANMDPFAEARFGSEMTGGQISPRRPSLSTCGVNWISRRATNTG